MTRKLLSILFLLLSLNVFSQTLIPDANFEQFLVDQGIDTNGLTGDILNADAAAVTNLNVNRNDITDFTGLEAFVAIVTINAGTNEFPTLPLNTLSDLEVLQFGTNRSLASLDVSQNLALRVLDIRSSISPDPPITTLDLSNNLNLEKLSAITFPNITSLTFPVTATLVDIDIANMSVPTIDLSQLTGDLDFRIIGSRVNVNIIYPNKRDALKRLELSSIDFPNVDVSEMIGLERFGLSSTFTETLQLPTTNTLTNINISVHELNAPISFASVPQLQNLSITTKWDTGDLKVDVSQNLELTNLTLNNNNMLSVDITNNTKLTNFRAYNNSLTALDVTQNVDLNRLEAYQNQLPSIDLSQNIDLQWLDLGQNLLPSLDVTNNTNLRSIDIDNNLFTGTGLDLTQNLELRTLTAAFNQIESLDITQNPELTFLTLNDNLFSGTAILDQFYVHYLNRSFMRVNLNVENNRLSGRIPDFFSPFPLAQQSRRNELLFAGNAFEFGDFEDEHLDYISLLSTMTLGSSPDFVFRNYRYAPQEKVNAIENPTRNAGESITLTTTVRGAQNHYKWFKDGVAIPNAADSPELILTNLNTCDAGVYHAEITSDLVPLENSDTPGTNGRNLLLVRNDITLTVNATKTCVTLDMPLTEVPVNSGIQWNDNSGACGYKISLGTTTGNDDILPLTDVGDVTVYNHPTNFPDNQEMFVTIIPYYDDGDFTCTEQSFRTNASTVAPDCTFISSPLNDDTNIAADLSRIEWNPANGADEYNVTISSPSGVNDTTTTTTETFLPLSNDFDSGEVVTVTIIPENSIGIAFGCSSETFTITNPTVVTPSTNAFITTWKTDNPGITDDNSIRIPTQSLLTYNYTIDWGDGVTTTETGAATHTYAIPGTYEVAISGTFPAIEFNFSGDKDKLLSIEQWGDIEWETMDDAFNGCTNLVGNFTDRPDLSRVTDMSQMFYACSSFNTNINDWDVSTVTDMNQMFRGASAFNQPLNDWDVSNVTTMNQMFMFTAFNQPLDLWDVSKVTNMSAMFRGAIDFNEDISGWVTTSSTNMVNMFKDARSFDQNLSNWNVERVLDADDMFDGITLSTPNYDALLIGWNSQNLQPTVNFSGGNSQFCESATERENIITTNGWTITDGGTTTVNNFADPNQTAVDSYTLPAITGNALRGAEAYYTEPNGGGTRYEAGAIINFADFTSYPVTLYIYDGTGSCTSEEFFELTITMAGASPPNCTSLISPGGGATNQPINLNAIVWDPITDATGYRLEVTTTSGNNNLTLTDIGSNNRHPFTELFEDNDVITVRIIPYNADGDAVGCMAESFTIENTNPSPTIPDCTEMTFPMPNSMNASNTTRIEWASVTEATGYRLQLGLTPGGTELLNFAEGDVGANNFYEIHTGLQYDYGATIYVTIRPYNAAGDTTGCEEQSFTVQEEPEPNDLSCTTLSSPMDNDIDIPVNLPSISWNPVVAADSYRITINGNSSDRNDQTNLIVTNTTHSFVNPFDNGETVTVTITPLNGDLEPTTNCISESFSIATDDVAMTPDCTFISTPTNESTNININTAISWETVTNADGYRLSVGTSPRGTEILEDEDLGILTSFSLPTLTQGTTYYVNITPYNSEGNATDCTEQSFTTVEIEDETKYGFSPNGDGVNDFWSIDNIEEYPDNIVYIYNRWGDMVFQIQEYDNGNNVFSGDANMKTKMGAGELPSGTYFFRININGNHNLKKTKGFLILKR